jgi:hypothetical protein
MWMLSGVNKYEQVYRNVVHLPNLLFAIVNVVLMLLNVSDAAAG